MEIISNIAWVFYINPESAALFENDKVGKWMYFFSDRSVVEKLCKEAVENGIVAEAKHSNDSEGVSCFYLNCDDIETQKKITRFFIDNNLIRRTKAGKYYNISFKLDSQTDKGEYGKGFKAEIKLDEFIDLETGEWIYEC